MFFNHSLPKKADIFIQSKPAPRFSLHYKPLEIFKVISIVLLGSLIIFCLAIILTPQQKTAASSITAAQTVHREDDNDHARMPTPIPVFIKNNTLRVRQVPSTFIPPGHTFV